MAAALASVAIRPQSLSETSLLHVVTEAEIRDKYENARSLGRVSYVTALASLFTKAMIFVVLITVSHLLLLPRARGVDHSRRRLALVANVAQIAVFLSLGIASWFTTLSW
ncbi:hypothetical protein V8F06_012793 [Rhypophila decipiens]